MEKVKYKAPKGYQDVTAYLRVADAASALVFYAAAFGAKEKYRLKMPDGRIGHAEMDFGDTRVMLSDEFPDMGIRGPKAVGGTSTVLSLYVSDADAVFERAIAAGAKVNRPLQDQFYGDRSGQLEDPFGHIWSIQTRIEDVSPKKMQKRLDAMAHAAPAPVPEPESKPKRKK
jgi:PhnB protein